ncbi:ogr/Delta-like zinc finger family protein [Limnobaculum xujianqingii]|uniref:ogr/Delta-like zinc finger family protein n=1 Tax=Limnobaculum xujianqingii TaxID=2738837 RepID=UPI00112B3C46|nr:ogr/Delta-like zinc finger family protein [Limnobaculum xujianqingii]
MRVMKVFCPACKSKATIKKTNRKHDEIADIYCACNDVECGHTFVMNLTFSHTISPSAKTTLQHIKSFLSLWSDEDKQIAIELLSNPA